MIILSAGMPRAGSGWFYNLTNDLVIAAGNQDGHQIRKKYRLGRFLTEVNCNIGALSTKRLIPILIPSTLGNTFVIKTHAGPTPLALRLIQHGTIRPTYIYRDPRDAMLSAYEYGQRGLQRGRPNAFSHLIDFETSLDFIVDYVSIWEQWTNCKDALHTRYEELKSDYYQEVSRLAKFLGLDEGDPAIQQVIKRYRPEQASHEQAGTHFSKGMSGRFREVYSDDEQAVIKARLGGTLEAMGYE